MDGAISPSIGHVWVKWRDPARPRDERDRGSVLAARPGVPGRDYDLGLRRPATGRLDRLRGPDYPPAAVVFVVWDGSGTMRNTETPLDAPCDT